MADQESTEHRSLLQTRTAETMPHRHPSISPSGRPYGHPATERQQTDLHEGMAPRESWTHEYDERIGLGRARDYTDVAPTAAEASLTVERHGHTVQLDSKGLHIDGKRVPGTSAPTKAEARQPGDPYHSSAFQVTDRGAVVLHGRIVAHLQRDQAPRLYGDDAPAWARGAGHTVVADSQGLLIDGERVSDRGLQAPVGHSPLRINSNGTVTWCQETGHGRNKERKHEPIAELTPKKGQGPVVYGTESDPKVRRQAEEDERRRRDERYRTQEQQQELIREGQEVTL